MRKRIFFAIIALLLIGTAGMLLSCADKTPPVDKDIILKFGFDEGTGYKLNDSSSKKLSAKLAYVFEDAKYMDEDQQPLWRSTGIKGGSLLMDGYSNMARLSSEDIRITSNQLTISVWIAPRAFESAMGSGKLTSIVSKYNMSLGQGFRLGYAEHGSWSFQFGINGSWVDVWDNGNPIQKYEWNHLVATFDGDNGVAKIYKNGVLANEKTFFDNVQLPDATDIDLFVGRDNNAGSNATAPLNTVSGLIDELTITKKLYSQEDVTKEFNDGLKNGSIPEISFEEIWLQDILTTDYYKPQYHGGPPQHWMNEPHAPMYYNGKYHLFFQFNLFGPYFANICWGHLVSDDMVNWKALKEVITPTAGTVATVGVWSGGSNYDSKGVPVLFFTAGGSGHYSGQNIGIARPKDPTDPNLTEWIVDDELAIAQASGQGKRNEFRDPQVFKDGDTWYMLICSAKSSGTGGTALIYTTTNDSFKNWTYRGEFYSMNSQPTYLGETWELPTLLPVANDAGTISKYAFIISPAPADKADNKIYYWIGDFNKETYRFIPDSAFGSTPKIIDYGGNVFTGPNGFVDPVSGKSYVTSIMQDQRKPGDAYASGWAHSVGLYREIYLNADGTDLNSRPVEALENYHGEVLYDQKQAKSIADTNTALAGIGGDMLHIKLVMKNVNAEKFGIKVRCSSDGWEFTEYVYDVATGTIGVKTGMSGKQNISGYTNGALALSDNTLTVEIYLDRSLAEAFFNGERAISSSIYPAKDSLGLTLFAENGSAQILSMYVATMKSIH